MEKSPYRNVVLLIGDHEPGPHRRSLSCRDLITLEIPSDSVINGLTYGTEKVEAGHIELHDTSGIFDYDTLQELEGRLCGIVDALFGEKTQREAMKSLVKKEIWDMFHDRRRLFEYEYKRLSSKRADDNNE
jgi:hypothetical protein